MEYKKYIGLFEKAAKLLKQEHVLMYGGSAINDILPKKLKFYNDSSLPDIDVLAPQALKVATRVANKLKAQGYEFTGVREALHENTFKVFVEGVHVLDVTNISPQVYALLRKGRMQGQHGLYTANVEYLRMTLHCMMSHPFDAYRWPKVYKRLAYFYKTYPMKPVAAAAGSGGSGGGIAIHPLLVATFVEWVRTHNFVFFGGPEVERAYFVDADAAAGDDRRNIIVAGDVRAVAEDFVAVLPQEVRRLYGVSVSKVIKSDHVFVPDHVFITCNGRPIFGIYSTEACVSYITVGNGTRVASFHTLCALYMGMAFVDKSTKIKDMVYRLGMLQHDLFKKKKHTKHIDQYVLECYGPHEGPITLRRKQMERRKM